MTPASAVKPFYFSSFLLIVICCLGLFLLDKDTHSVVDLFKPGNLAALVVYVIPTYLICPVIFYFLDKTEK